MGKYKPCSFNRDDYLEHAVQFEYVELDCCQNELTEFSDDAEGLAFELAYTRYALAKAEKSIIKLNKKIQFIFDRRNFGSEIIPLFLRPPGYEIPDKAEDEQAHVIHWILCFYAKHGEAWKDEADKVLNKSGLPIKRKIEISKLWRQTALYLSNCKDKNREKTGCKETQQIK